jgi:hypothetical protein
MTIDWDGMVLAAMPLGLTGFFSSLLVDFFSQYIIVTSSKLMMLGSDELYDYTTGLWKTKGLAQFDYLVLYVILSGFLLPIILRVVSSCAVSYASKSVVFLLVRFSYL